MKTLITIVLLMLGLGVSAQNNDAKEGFSLEIDGIPHRPGRIYKMPNTIKLKYYKKGDQKFTIEKAHIDAKAGAWEPTVSIIKETSSKMNNPAEIVFDVAGNEELKSGNLVIINIRDVIRHENDAKHSEQFEEGEKLFVFAVE